MADRTFCKLTQDLNSLLEKAYFLNILKHIKSEV